MAYSTILYSSKSTKPAKTFSELALSVLSEFCSIACSPAYHIFIKWKNRFFPRAWDCCHHGTAKKKSQHNRKTADRSAKITFFFCFYYCFSVFFVYIVFFLVIRLSKVCLCLATSWEQLNLKAGLKAVLVKPAFKTAFASQTSENQSK